METGSSAEVADGVMASVDGSIRRDNDYIEGVLFSDGSTRAELDECADETSEIMKYEIWNGAFNNLTFNF